MSASTRTFPAGSLKLITPGASALDPTPRGLYIDTAGTINFTNQDDTTVTGLNVVAGSVLPFQPKKITAASSAVVYGFYG